MMYLTCGIEEGAKRAEQILAEDDAKHRVLSEPKHPIFRTEPVKRLACNGEPRNPPKGAS